MGLLNKFLLRSRYYLIEMIKLDSPMGHDHNQFYIFMRKYITPMGVFRKIGFSNGAC